MTSQPLADLTMARAYLTTTQTVNPGGGMVAVKLDTTDFDPGGHMNAGGGASAGYTCPTDGYYMVVGQTGASSSASGDQLQVFLWLNGSNNNAGAAIQARAVSQPLISQAVALMSCLAGASIQLATQTTGSSLNLNTTASRTFLCVHRVA